MSDWIKTSARAGYVAKGVVYGVVGLIALRAAFGGRSEAAGTREALEFVESGPFGNLLVGSVAVGLAGYVVWRLVQAILNPEGKGDESKAKELGMRLFYLASAAIYAALTWHAVQMLLDTGGGSSSTQARVADIMAFPGGRWIVGAFGAGMIARGVKQGMKAYTQSFMKRVSSFELGPRRRKGVVAISRVGLTARGLVFVVIGGLFLRAAVQYNASEARGTDGALQLLADQPWLLGGVGVGMLCYAVYQWAKARYRLISV